MIRFILKVRHKREDSSEVQEFYTIPLEVPELEKALKKGGYGESSFERHELVGVEIFEEVEE